MILTVVLLIGYLNLQMTLNWWAVYSEEEIEQFRLDIKRLYDWSVDWQMRFNTDKCKTLHFGYANVRTVYSLGD